MDKLYAAAVGDDGEARVARPNAQIFVAFAPGVVLGVYLAAEHRQEPPRAHTSGTPRVGLRLQPGGLDALEQRLREIRLRCLQPPWRTEGLTCARGRRSTSKTRGATSSSAPNSAGALLGPHHASPDGRREPHMPFTLIELRILADLADGRTLASIAADVGLGRPGGQQAGARRRAQSGLTLARAAGAAAVPHAAGFELARAAQGVLGRERAFEQTLADLRAGRAGPLRLLATSTTGNYVLPTVIGEFLQIVPDAQVELRLLPPGAIRDMIIREPMTWLSSAPRRARCNHRSYSSNPCTTRS